MKRWWVYLLVVFFAAAWMAEGWAHSSRGSYRTPVTSRQYAPPPVYAPPAAGVRAPQRFQTPQYERQPVRPYPWRRGPQAGRLPRIENGVLYSKPGPLQRQPSQPPAPPAYGHGYLRPYSPLPRAVPVYPQGRPQPPFQPSLPAFMKTDPWFLYGHDNLPR